MTFRASLTEGCGIDIGIGENALMEVGMSDNELGASIVSIFHDLFDGGCNALNINGIKIYARRRGHCVDVGNRQDFRELGWGLICDVLDTR